MLAALKRLFASDPEAAGAAPAAAAEAAVAATLLVEAALVDGDFDATEKASIERLLAERYALDGATLAGLIGRAETAARKSTQLYGLTKRLKNELDYDERIELVEMLWTVVLSNGELHDFEAGLMRRLAGLLYVEDADSGAARKRVEAHL
ncbi:TerB family tellurite resistance protein [Roseospirillum parvum]|uniref:Uncharacterized conserved protein, tellurite resistance protein B (TerB) family n=1 Tax=Roseospirillum parvum TaxID=83401 RepID=A0A1G8BQY9_9PROT|nr:TerB family tellurite resistance protein [Roseospirillum parvum]SDH35625.1 Uncharacterized conserved protein, tellurite resistance protein B (TerB) family [Roseospirillum parvum]